MIGIAGLVLGIAVGPKLVPNGDGSEVAGGTTTTLFERGPTVTLPEVTLNLADGRLLRIGLALQLPHDPDRADGESEGTEGDEEETVDDPTMGHAPDLDAAISVFSTKTMDELLGEPGREAARAELLARIAEHHEEPVIEGVLFYQFVMQ
jgi:flagellar FliL protein